MRRFILTGAPGAGKTAIIRQLEIDGFSVVEEAATDVIAAAQAQGTTQPWTDPSCIDVVARLQKDREIRASCRTSHRGLDQGSYQADEVQFHDRCVVCTAALATYLGYPVSPFLAGELERVKKEAVFQSEFSSFAILASLRRREHVESATRRRCALRRFMKRLTGSSASN